MMLTSPPLSPVKGALNPDDFLAARAIAGDDAALEELIARHEDRVYALARAILKQAEWAEDATQETFLKVVQRLPEYDRRNAKFEMWVLCIARNVAVSWWRKRHVRGEMGFENTRAQDEFDAASDGVSPLEQAIAQEQMDRVLKAIDTLAGPLRELLVLRYFHGLEPSEIAEVTGIEPGHARVKLCRALQTLREKLSEGQKR